MQLEENSCEHPSSKVQLLETTGLPRDSEIPQYYTVLGQCDCGATVEVDFESHSINEG